MARGKNGFEDEWKQLMDKNRRFGNYWNTSTKEKRKFLILKHNVGGGSKRIPESYVNRSFRKLPKRTQYLLKLVWEFEIDERSR